MKKYVLFSLLILMISSTFFACKKNDTIDIDEAKGPIVTVLGKTLYQTDLKGLSSYGMSAEDSTCIVKTYINTWIEDQLVYNNALKNLPEDQEIEKLVEAYRKTLITNSYLNKLLGERLNESIPDTELFSFFEENKELFSLKENIIKGLYLKVPKESSQLQNFKKWYKDDSEDAVNNIEKYYLQHTVGYDNFYSYWVSLDKVISNTPEIITDKNSFLKNNKTLEVSDSSFVYLLNIKDYKLAGDEVPFEYIKDRLTEAYKEKQRKEFMKTLSDDLYDKALSSGEILFYNNAK